MSLIQGYATDMSVRARQKLKTAEAAKKFNHDLLEKIRAYQEKGLTPAFTDFDVSQNPMPSEQLAALFCTFRTTGVRVEMLRMFGCATLDDNAMVSLAGWLRTVTPETAPMEMHLSDCAISLEGFFQLLDATEGNDAFPGQDRTGRRCPLYLRLENNYIQPETAIQAKINEGVITPYKKNSGPIRCSVPSAPDAKIKLLGKVQRPTLAFKWFHLILGGRNPQTPPIYVGGLRFPTPPLDVGLRPP